MKMQLFLVIAACNKTYEQGMPAKLVVWAMRAVALPQFQPSLPKRPALRPACPLNSHLTTPIPRH